MSEETCGTSAVADAWRSSSAASQAGIRPIYSDRQSIPHCRPWSIRIFANCLEPKPPQAKPPSLWLRYLGAPTLSFHDLVLHATAKVTESGAIADTTRRIAAPFESGAILVDPFGRQRLGRRPLPSQQHIRSIGPLHAEMLGYRIWRKQRRTNQGVADI